MYLAKFVITHKSNHKKIPMKTLNVEQLEAHQQAARMNNPNYGRIQQIDETVKLLIDERISLLTESEKALDQIVFCEKGEEISGEIRKLTTQQLIAYSIEQISSEIQVGSIQEAIMDEIYVRLKCSGIV